ncbi:hypothetical protein [Diplocloster agilis]|nr:MULTISPECIES: hypothetical protein [Lachnospiraceae]MCU6732391.1 hypothetical protein [Suonthocola fibrivorans]SCI45395.1 Uncharacterised protein [uncultured Clostridium sp.]
MNDMNIIRVDKNGLTEAMKLLLYERYTMEPDDFVVLYDLNADTLFVDPMVPEQEVSLFARIAGAGIPCINDPDSELAPVSEQIIRTYGFTVWLILFDCYQDRRKWKTDRKSREDFRR